MQGPLLALLLSLAVPTVHAQDPAAVEDVQAAADDAAIAAPHDSVVAEADARAQKAHEDLARARRNLRLTMGLVALLVLWLVTRLMAPKPVVEQPHHRAMAMNHEELGRLVFQVARSRDFFGFRDLFLNAHEASQLLGMQEADSYLQLRSDESLRDALGLLADACHPGTIFGGVVPVDGGLLGIRVNEPNGQHFVLAVGSVTELESGCRLHLAAPHLAAGSPTMAGAQRS